MILVFAFYAIKKAYSLPNNKSFFLLILGLIVCGTIAGAYAVFIQYLFYDRFANLPVLNRDQILCIDSVIKNQTRFTCPEPNAQTEA